MCSLLLQVEFHILTLLSFFLVARKGYSKEFSCIRRYGSCLAPQLYGNNSIFGSVYGSQVCSNILIENNLYFQEKHEENHQPKLHGGLVIKHNANQRYATNAVTAIIFREIAERHLLPIQVSSCKKEPLLQLWISLW